MPIQAEEATVHATGCHPCVRALIFSLTSKYLYKAMRPIYVKHEHIKRAHLWLRMKKMDPA